MVQHLVVSSEATKADMWVAMKADLSALHSADSKVQNLVVSSEATKADLLALYSVDSTVQHLVERSEATRDGKSVAK